ncbi:MAG TPA: DUF885 domain-containing protein, partial [Gemmatimonadales bacterium]|nr:DUF885 domain-containing protein [Gemmatimonadales bacterium]
NDIEPSPDPQAFAIGEEQFTRRLQHEHAIKASPGELWRYGTRLQEEVTEQLAEQASKLGSSSWRELIDRLREDSPAPEELIGIYRAEIERACRFVTERDLVNVPAARIEVVTTPGHLAPMVPFAAYEPPPIYLTGRSGRFYVTKPNAASARDVVAQQRQGHCRHAIPAMVAHEVYPGHHLHLATMQSGGSEVRRHIWSPFMVEGWAVYSEQLMAETGYYPTAEARLFQLVNLLWRAIRIVVDIGLHTRGLTPADAVEYMVRHLPIEHSNAEAEVRRYCAWPTYQLCYAVGRRELLSLRDAYRQRHGSQVGLRRFHDELLSYGGIPVSLARWGMELAE